MSDRRPVAEVYLDANATTRVLPEAARAADAAMEILYGNPSSSHVTGLRARYILERTRRRAATLLGAGEGRIVFTSGATEAIQMAVLSALRELDADRHHRTTDGARRTLLYGATEHKAVPEALRHWSTLLGLDHDVVPIPVDRQGRLDLAFLREHAPHADMVSTMAVNNETGVVHDLTAVEAVLREANPRVRWLADCVQAVGKQHLDLAHTTIDYACASGHKIYATKGIGLLYVRKGTPVTPLIIGGGQEEGARSGTENLPGVAALGAVFEHLLDPDDTIFRTTSELVSFRDRLLAALRASFPDIAFNTPFEHALPTTINFAVEGLTSKELLDLFDAAGMRVSAGSACGSAIGGSHVLDAMGLPTWQSEGAIRLSFGPATTEAEISAACTIIAEAGRAMQGACVLVSDDIGDARTGERHTGLIQLKRGSSCTWLYATADGRCIVVDPVADLCHRIESFVRCQDARVVAILDTHDHNDRPPCREMLLELLGARAREARTRDPLGWPDDPDTTVTLADGERAPALRLAGDEVLARTPLPGHTAEGRAYLLGSPDADGRLGPDAIRLAYTGDTVLIGGLGRTDFDVSVVASLHDSLTRLERIVSPVTVICPTHDYTNDFCTTLAAERTAGGLLSRVLDPVAPISREAFVEEMRRMDAEIEKSPSELICGLIDVRGGDETSMNVTPEELGAFFRAHGHSHVVDVREIHESRYFGGWEAMGLSSAPLNVPLTRFTDFLARLLHGSHEAGDYEVILFCRSGNRSARAASVLRRLGVTGSWHLEGGLARCSPELTSRT